MDVIRIKVPSKTDNVLDIFSIEFEHRLKNTYMVLAWDNTRVDIPIKVKDHLVAKI
jgi:hypothetical protein